MKAAMSSYKYDTYSEMDDDESIYSNNRNKVIKAMTNIHSDDKLCFSRKIRGQNGKFKKLLMFGSGDTGTTIRNAVTGERYYGQKVGSKKEDLYFKARLCTGEFGPNPVTLFYESAEQFEKHLGGSVEQAIKEKVSLRQRLARALGEDESRPRENVVIH